MWRWWRVVRSRFWQMRYGIVEDLNSNRQRRQKSCMRPGAAMKTGEIEFFVGGVHAIIIQPEAGE
jgi:hypothetical protein